MQNFIMKNLCTNFHRVLKGYKNNDKNTFCLPRQDAKYSLEPTKNQGFGENVKEIYPYYTPFDYSTTQ